MFSKALPKVMRAFYHLHKTTPSQCLNYPRGAESKKNSYVDGRDGFTQIVNGSIFYGGCGLLNFFIQTGLALGVYPVILVTISYSFVKQD